MEPKPLNIFDVYEYLMMSNLLNSPAKKLIALRIIKYDGKETGRVSFSQTWLAKKFGVGRTTVWRTLKELEAAEIIKTISTHGYPKTTEVEINWYGLKVLTRRYKEGSNVSHKTIPTFPRETQRAVLLLTPKEQYKDTPTFAEAEKSEGAMGVVRNKSRKPLQTEPVYDEEGELVQESWLTRRVRSDSKLLQYY